MEKTDTTISGECDNCGRVEAKILGFQVLPPDDLRDPQQTVFAECPGCRQPLVFQHWYYEQFWYPDGRTEGEWTSAKRVWPSPDPVIPHELPEAAHESLREAQKCLGVGASIACAAMCGRALEAICRDQNANEKMLAAGLQELRDKGEIDTRLYEWGKELNAKRNIAAHPDPTPISQTDAQYLFDFALAISEYIYVMSAKFERFKSGK